MIPYIIVCGLHLSAGSCGLSRQLGLTLHRSWQVFLFLDFAIPIIVITVTIIDPAFGITALRYISLLISVFEAQGQFGVEMVGTKDLVCKRKSKTDSIQHTVLEK